MSTIEEIINNEYGDDNSNSQEVKPSESQTAKQETTQSPVNNPVNVTATKNTSVPYGINESIPGNNPQVSIPDQQYHEITKEDMDNIRQGKNVMDLLNYYYNQQQLDEKALSRNRMFGAIGDSLKLLGKAFAVSKGAHIMPDDPNNSLTNYFLNEENKLRDIYRQHQDTYNKIRLNLALQDRQRQEYDKKTKEQREYNEKIMKQNQEFQSNLAKEKQTADENLLNKRLEAQKTNAEYVQGQITGRNQTNQAAQNYRSGQRNAISEKSYQSKAENNKDYYTKLAGEARNDPDFIDYMNSHPDLFYDIKKDVTGEKSRSILKNNASIGATYENWKNSRQKTDQKDNSVNSQGWGNYYPDWKKDTFGGMFNGQ